VESARARFGSGVCCNFGRAVHLQRARVHHQIPIRHRMRRAFTTPPPRAAH